MRKRLIGLLLASVLTVSLSACGNDGQNTNPADLTIQEVYVNESPAESEPETVTEYSEDELVESSDAPVINVDVDVSTNNEEINFFIDRDVSNKDRLVSLYFSDKDENGNPTMLYTKGGSHSEITLCNYQILSGTIENCSMENSIIVYADCIYSDGETDQLSFNMYPSGEGNKWEMMITSPADIEGFYVIDGDGPAVAMSEAAASSGTVQESYWFVDYLFVSDDGEASFKLISTGDGVPAKVEMIQGEPYNTNEVYDIESFSVEQGPLYTVHASYLYMNSEGEESLVALDFECQDGEAIVSAPGNMYGHYMGF